MQFQIPIQIRRDIGIRCYKRRMRRTPRHKQTPRFSPCPIFNIRNRPIRLDLRPIKSTTRNRVPTIRDISPLVVIMRIVTHIPLIVKTQTQRIARIDLNLAQMPLANIPASIPGCAKRRANTRIHTQIGIKPIGRHPRMMAVFARHQHRAIRRTNRRTRNRCIQTHPLSGKRIKLRRVEILITIIAPHRRRPLLI